MLALALPLCLLYEVAVAVARWTDKRRARRDAESEFAGLDDDEASPLPVDREPVDREPLQSGPAGDARSGRSTARVGGSTWDADVT
jgi:sec-independent protein translocase protein TatC